MKNVSGKVSKRLKPCKDRQDPNPTSNGNGNGKRNGSYDGDDDDIDFENNTVSTPVLNRKRQKVKVQDLQAPSKKVTNKTSSEIVARNNGNENQFLIQLSNVEQALLNKMLYFGIKKLTLNNCERALQYTQSCLDKVAYKMNRLKIEETTKFFLYGFPIAKASPPINLLKMEAVVNHARMNLFTSPRPLCLYDYENKNSFTRKRDRRSVQEYRQQVKEAFKILEQKKENRDRQLGLVKSIVSDQLNMNNEKLNTNVTKEIIFDTNKKILELFEITFTAVCRDPKYQSACRVLKLIIEDQFTVGHHRGLDNDAIQFLVNEMQILGKKSSGPTGIFYVNNLD